MRKYICDKCGEEVSTVIEVTARLFKKHSKDGSIDTMRMLGRKRFCPKCYRDMVGGPKEVEVDP